jgi:6-phosphogluconolactonase (cycloisomerase 2 family)
MKSIVPLGICAVVVLSLSFTGCGSNSGGAVPNTNGSAASGTQGLTAEYLYALDNPGGASNVETFQINLATGALVPSGNAAAGNNANDIVADTQSRFLFVGNSPGCCAAAHPPAQLMSFGIGGSGNLTPLQTVSLPNTDDTLQSLAFDSAGSVYASSTAGLTGGTISSFSVDRASGAISNPTAVASMPMPGKIVAHPNGTFVYAAVNSGGIDLLTRNASTGALTDTKRIFPAGSGDPYTDMSFAQGGTFLVAVSQNSRKMTIFSVNGSTGDLTVVTQTPDDFLQVTAIVGGKYVFSTHSNNSVETHMMFTDGNLLQIGYASTPVQVRNVVVDAGGKFVYAQSVSTPQIFGFAIDGSTGKLTPIPGSPFATGAITSRMAVAAR